MIEYNHGSLKLMHDTLSCFQGMLQSNHAATVELLEHLIYWNTVSLESTTTTDASVVEVVVVVVQELERPAAGNAPPPIPPPTPNLAGGATVNDDEDFSEEAAIEIDAAAGCEDEAALEFAAASEDADTTTPLQTN